MDIQNQSVFGVGDVWLAGSNKDIGRGMKRRSEIVIRKKKIRVLYHYPFRTAGPSELEQQLKGWIFEETVIMI